LELPSRLFADYLEAKRLARDHRYDEALGQYYEALRLDPLNLYIRLEIGALQEQLHLFLDALETYDDIVALGTRRDERFTHAVLDALAVTKDTFTAGPGDARRRWAHRAGHPLGEGWRGKRARDGLRPAAWRLRSANRHRALLFARYRYAMVLGFSEVFLAQWIQDLSGRDVSKRDAERYRLRARLLPRLERYPYVSSVPMSILQEALEDRTILRVVTPVDDRGIDEQERIAGVEADLKRAVKSVRKKAKRQHNCADFHVGFAKRAAAAYSFDDDDRPATALTLHGAAKSLLAATQLCSQKDWATERGIATAVLPNVGPRETPRPTALAVLCAQELLQQAALAEIRQLARDYRWWTGRRRWRISVTSRALRVSIEWATLRLQRVEWLLTGELRNSDPDRRAQPRAADTWPPPISVVRRRINGALRRRPYLIHEWQDHYNAACTYAISLLPDNSWAGNGSGLRLAPSVDPPADEGSPSDGRHDEQFAAAVVRSLERAIDSSDSYFAAGRRNWLTSEDPDLVGFRVRDEYSRFRARNFPSVDRAVPLPKNVHVLQMSAYVTELIRTFCSVMQKHWADCLRQSLRGSSAEAVNVLFEEDRQAWQTILDLAKNHRDWRVRLGSLSELRRFARAAKLPTPGVSYPSYPDARIGELSEVSNPEDVRCLSIAGAYARQERVAQIERLAQIVESGLASRLPITTQDFDQSSKEAAATFLQVQARAWLALADCLALKFFTDDKTVLDERKKSALIREIKFNDVVSGWASPPIIPLRTPGQTESRDRVQR
jgi:hypothetical protein